MTIPLEVALAGMPGLEDTQQVAVRPVAPPQPVRLRHRLRQGPQEVINRLQFVEACRPASSPTISPASPTGEILRYTLASPKDAPGRSRLHAQRPEVAAGLGAGREFRRVPRIIDVISFGGTVKRYEIHPDPDRSEALRHHARAAAEGHRRQQRQRRRRLSDRRRDNRFDRARHRPDRRRQRSDAGRRGAQRQDRLALRPNTCAPRKSAAGCEIRQIVITSVNNVPVRVGRRGQGGPLRDPSDIGSEGVVVGHQTRLGQVMLSTPKQKRKTRDSHRRQRQASDGDEDERVQGIVLLRKGEDSLPALQAVEQKIEELNDREWRGDCCPA